MKKDIDGDRLRLEPYSAAGKRVLHYVELPKSDLYGIETVVIIPHIFFSHLFST